MRHFALVTTLALSTFFSFPSTAFGYATKVSKVVTGEPTIPTPKIFFKLIPISPLL